MSHPVDSIEFIDIYFACFRDLHVSMWLTAPAASGESGAKRVGGAVLRGWVLFFSCSRYNIIREIDAAIKQVRHKLL
jgi:hypothetical protein